MIHKIFILVLQASVEAQLVDSNYRNKADKKAYRTSVTRYLGSPSLKPATNKVPDINMSD